MFKPADKRFMVDAVECHRLAKMSQVILSSVVSVERSLLYADWTASMFDDVDACGTNRINTSRSKILLIVFKLEMGR